MVVNPTYEAYDNFKKKHLAQNKEIIHKNTELSKLNAELNRTVTLLRAERLSLKGSHFQLECENASLRTALERAESRERELLARQEGQVRGSWGGMDREQVETVRRSLASAMATLNACGSILPSTGNELSRPSFVGSSPATPTPPTPASASSSSSSTASLPPNANVSVSRRRSLASRAARETMTARPDLSYISEGGEGSAEMDDGGDDDGGWRGPVLEGLREESQPSSQTPSAFSSPAAAPSSTYDTSPAPEPTPISTNSPPPPLTSSPNPTLAALSLSSSSTAKPSPKSRTTAPPSAPSSASYQTSTDRRPARRVSGLVRPPPPPPAAAAPRGGRAGISEVEDEQNGAEGARKGTSFKGREREALSEVQVPAAEVERGAGGGVRRRNSRQSRLLEMSSSSSEGGEEEEDPSADEYEPEVPTRPPTPSPPRPLRPPPGLSLSAAGAGSKSKKVATETVSGTSIKGNPRKKVIELGAVAEEATSSRRSYSRTADVSDEVAPSAEPSEGRRARKSVNYALPKLNTKMRRPEDYVPLTSVQAGKAPRKSTLKPVHSSSSSSSSTLGLNSLPRSSSGSVKPLSAGETPTSNAAGGEEGSDDDEPDDVLPPRKSRAGQEMEERRREKVLAAQGAGGAPKIGRRHSVAV